MDIIIKPTKEQTSNETQCLGLMNVGYLHKKIEIRVNTPVIFYITDLYI
jgi:hypothetical protein